MDNFRALGKLIAQLTIILVFMLISAIGQLLIRDLAKRRRFHGEMASFFGKLCLKVLQVKLTVTGKSVVHQNHLLIGNHTGFIDVLCLVATSPALFVTSIELRETPGLGLFSEVGGCLYVERRNRAGIHKEILSIREALHQGTNVILYPEAAACSGEKIYPFRKSLLTAAAGTGVPVLPVVTNFRKVNGEVMSHKWRDWVFWHGTLGFFGCAWRAHKLRSIEVHMEYLQPILCQTEDQRREVAILAQKQIEAKYVAIPFPTSV